ncbi:hypothetical protein TRFO_04486 [Tritrichomonas foetus]|uniref:Uncharacterized protein n=1 Tax=Tritrichomonas foetus TaxID=1144522 RepID=A0A1J4KEJ3_9EUKA|nr:hypothetical protein TRFO_04486 [Tritrichomonas foetus]|eukprot:OHT09434.1 hypothetical protein TRFO_04486 [Tritrichomonas foetus]
MIEEIESSLEEIAEDLDKNELSEIDFYALSDNISQRKALFENIETLKHANLEYYESTKILITKGIIISTLTKHFNQLKEFYEEFPKEMNEEEKVKYRLNRRIQLLERENQSMKIANEKILKDRENWKNKFIALEKDYQNLNELVSDMKKENASLRKEKVLLQKENALLQKTKTDEQKKEENEKRKEEIQCSIEDMNEFFENVDKDDPEKIVEYISENLEDFQFLLEDLLENIKY